MEEISSTHFSHNCKFYIFPVTFIKHYNPDYYSLIPLKKWFLSSNLGSLGILKSLKYPNSYQYIPWLIFKNVGEFTEIWWPFTKDYFDCNNHPPQKGEKKLVRILKKKKQMLIILVRLYKCHFFTNIITNFQGYRLISCCDHAFYWIIRKRDIKNKFTKSAFAGANCAKDLFGFFMETRIYPWLIPTQHFTCNVNSQVYSLSL